MRLTAATPRAAAEAAAGAAIILAAAVAVGLRPLLPVDETRYLTVAWEMWSRGDFLVPHLNGDIYTHKPPVLFWMINLVWSVGGVSQVLARLVPAMFGIGTVLVTGWLAALLWPQETRLHRDAVLMLVGLPVFVLFATMAMFDVPLAFFTTLGLAAVAAAARTRNARFWGLFAVALGGGILTKGPVALLFLLPAPLLAPYWWPAAGQTAGRRWYGQLAAGFAGGLAVVLLWLVPAVIWGGKDYASGILWHQTADRVAASLGHPRPWWFYLAIIPAFLYPWGWMPSVWRGLRRCAPADRGVRFCLCVIVPVFVILSVFNGKQFHYLIPAFPPLALIAARGLAASRDHWRWGDVLLPALPPALVGLVLLAWPVASGLPFLAERAHRAPAWLAALSPLWGLAFLGAALVPCAVAAWRRAGATLAVCATTLLSLIAVHVVGSVAIFAAYDLTAVSAYLQKHADLPIAYNRDYEGEFGFLGRLHGRRVEFVHEPDMARWIERHGRALVVARFRTLPTYLTGAPALEQPYRGQRIGVWLTTGGARRPP